MRNEQWDMIDAKYIKTDYRSCSIREAMYKFVGKAIFFFIDKRKKKSLLELQKLGHRTRACERGKKNNKWEGVETRTTCWSAGLGRSVHTSAERTGQVGSRCAVFQAGMCGRPGCCLCMTQPPSAGTRSAWCGPGRS